MQLIQVIAKRGPIGRPRMVLTGKAGQSPVRLRTPVTRGIFMRHGDSNAGRSRLGIVRVFIATICGWSARLSDMSNKLQLLLEMADMLQQIMSKIVYEHFLPKSLQIAAAVSRIWPSLRHPSYSDFGSSTFVFVALHSVQIVIADSSAFLLSHSSPPFAS